MKLSSVSLAFLACLPLACVAAGGENSDAAAAARPEGVALCYTEASSSHPAVVGFWSVFTRGDRMARLAAIDALEAAARELPEEEELALLLGLAHLWRIAEPLPEEEGDLGITIQAAVRAEAELERAYELCPTDHRIPAWLGPLKINMGRGSMSAALEAEGFAILDRGIEHYPAFVLFSKLLAYADLPADDPDFQSALAAVEANIDACAGNGPLGLSGDPACGNHPRAYRNIEGASVFMGDVFAKAGRRDEALAFYSQARSAPEYDTWVFQDLLEERIASLDARIAFYRIGAPATRPDEIWKSNFQCLLCHQR